MTVKLIRFDFYNGFTYRQCRIPLDNQGLVLLLGKNGHGKSTPWEILEHTFYGDTSRGLKKNAIVCTVPRGDPKEEAGFLSEIEMSRDCGGDLDGRWLIREARDHGKYGTTYRVFRDLEGKWKDRWEGGGCPKGLEDARKFGARLLGLRQNEFEGCLYLSQSGTHTLIEGKPSEKLLYLSYLFGADRYDGVQKILSEKAKEAEKALLGTINLEAKLEALRGQASEYPEAKILEVEILELTEELSSAEAAFKEWSGRRDDARDAIKTGDQRRSLGEELEEIGEVNESKYRDIDQDIKKWSDLRDSLQRDLKDAEQRDSIGTKIKALGDVPDEDVAKELKLLTKGLVSAKQLVVEIQKRQRLEAELGKIKVQQSVEELTEQISFVEKNLEVKRSKYRDKMAEYKELDSQITEFKTGVCPTCKRPMDIETMKSRLLDLSSETSTLYEEIQKPKQKLVDLKGLLDAAQRYEALARQIKDLPGDPLEPVQKTVEEDDLEVRRLTAVSENQTKLRTLRSMLESIHTTESVEDLAARLKTIGSDLQDLSGISKKLSQIRTIKKQLEKLPEVDLDAAAKELSRTEKVLQEQQETIRTAQSKVATLESKQKARGSIEREIAEVEQELAGLEDLRRQYTVLKYATTVVPKLKKRKIHKIVCAIRDVLPRYTGTMFSHEPNTKFVVEEDEKEESIDLIARRMVEVDGKLEPVLIPVKGFSGGEKQRLSVALLFTLHSLLDPTKRPDLLVLDEVDKALDDLGIASLMSLVSEAKEQYGTVIMTSHRSISGAHFDQVWHAEKTNEVSTFHLGPQG